MNNKLKKITWLGIFIANIIVIIWIWWAGSGFLLNEGGAGQLVALGRLSGLLAVYLALWQLILIGRIRPLEQLFGLDRLSVIHRFNGSLAWLFIFLHPLLLIIGYGRINNHGFWSQVYQFLFSGDDLVAALVSFLVFLVVISLSVGAIKKRIKYEIWYYVHLLTYLAIILAFGHQLEIGGDLQTNFANIYWRALYIIVAMAVIYYRFFIPARFFYRHRFFVDRIVIENEQVVSVYIGGRDLNKFTFRAGQFAIFRFLSGRLALEAHPFSFSLAPGNHPQLRITIKNLGDFTGSLKDKLLVGAPVLIDGPYGIFTAQRTDNKKLALIAGGIGITPLRAMLEKETDKDIVLFYSVARSAELVFLEELKSFNRANFKFIPIVSDGADWPGEQGRLDEEKIKRLLPDYSDRDFFICGPPSMIKAVRKKLLQLGLPSRRVYFEKFSLG